MHHCHKPLASDHGLLAQVEVQEAYGKQSPQRYPLDPPDPKSVTGEGYQYPQQGYGRASGQAAPLCAAQGGAGAGVHHHLYCLLNSAVSGVRM